MCGGFFWMTSLHPWNKICYNMYPNECSYCDMVIFVILVIFTSTNIKNGDRGNIRRICSTASNKYFDYACCLKRNVRSVSARWDKPIFVHYHFCLPLSWFSGEKKIKWHYYVWRAFSILFSGEIRFFRGVLEMKMHLEEYCDSRCKISSLRLFRDFMVTNCLCIVKTSMFWPSTF